VIAMTLEFGSRSGSWFAAVFFAIVFATLGWSVTREIRPRAGATATGFAKAAGFALALGPFGLVWLTSLNGFYTAELDAHVLRLRSLIPLARTSIQLTDIAAVEARPWYRGRWRLHVVTTTGRRFVSATSDRNSVTESTSRLKRHLVNTPRGKSS